VSQRLEYGEMRNFGLHKKNLTKAESVLSNGFSKTYTTTYITPTTTTTSTAATTTTTTTTTTTNNNNNIIIIIKIICSLFIIGNTDSCRFL
jgi:hypothetical protein